MGAGDSRQRSDLLAGLPLISKTKRECPVGTPSFVLSGGIAAWGKGLPSVSRLRAGRVPPAPAACGPLTLPTLCGGGAAARPACLRQSGKCGGQGRACGASRASWPPPLLGGTLPRRKAKHLRCALRAALPRSSPSPVAAQVLRGGPAPTVWGLWGRPPLRPGRRRSGQPCQPGHACGAGRAARLCLRTRRPA